MIQNNHKQKVLLVDAQPDTPGGQRLEDCGFEVILAAGVEDGMERAALADVVVLAVHAGQAAAAAEMARAFQAQSTLPVLFWVDDSAQNAVERLAEMPHTGLFSTISSPIFWKATIQAALHQAEIKRSQSEELFHAIFEQSPIGIELYNAEGQLVDQNQVCLDLFGVVNPAEVRHFNLFEDPNIPEAYKTALHRGLPVRYRAPYDFEQVKAAQLYPTTRAGIAWLDLIISPLKDRKGRISGYTAQIQDITARKQMETQLQRESRHYALLMQTSRDAIHVLDQNGKLIDWNAAFLAHLGYSAQEAAALAVSDWNAQWQPDELSAQIRYHIEHPGTFETRHKRKDGTIVDVEITAAGFEMEGQPVVYATARDITDRKRAEAALRESQQKYSILFENKIFAIMIFNPQSLHLLDANDAFLHLYGYEREDLLAGLSTLDLTAEEDASKASMAQALHEGTIFVPLRYHRKKDGSIFPVEIIASTHVWRGQTVIFSIIHDITDRERMQEVLLTSAARSHALFNQAHDAVFVLDMQGRHLTANQRAADMLGYSIEELSTLSVNETSAEIAQSQNILARLVAGEHIPLYERKFRKKDGDIFPVEINLELIRDKNGQPLHIQSIVRDISQRKQAENALKRINDQLTYRISQVEQLQAELEELALRDPLTGLYNRRYLSETLVREIARAEREHGHLSVIVADLDHFKTINDTYGHVVGDHFLIAIARLMKSCTRISDLVCRYGGEEFVIVLPGATLDVARRRAEEIRQMCSATHIQHEGQDLKVTASFGVAAFPEHGSEAEPIIIKADKALYQSKNNGRNRVTVWGEE